MCLCNFNPFVVFWFSLDPVTDSNRLKYSDMVLYIYGVMKNNGGVDMITYPDFQLTIDVNNLHIRTWLVLQNLTSSLRQVS